MTNIASITMPELMRNITLHIRVTGQRVTAIRFWLGTRLLRLAAWVIGCGIEIDTESPITFDAYGVPSRYGVGDAHLDASAAQRLIVYLDGVEQDKVVSYNIDRGEIIAWVDLIQVMKRGAVEARMKDGL
jgi:hypothetical protein